MFSDPFIFNYYSFSALVNFVTSIVIGTFIYFKNRKESINLSFALFAWSVSAWSLAYFFWQVSTTEKVALFWSRALMVGAIFAAITYLHFIFSVLDIVKQKRKFLILSYIIFLIFFLFNFTSLFVKKVEPALSFSFWPKPGPVYHIFLLTWFSYLIYSAYLLISKLKITTGIKKVQIKFVLVAMIIAFVGGSTNYFLWYNIPIPPIGNILVSLYVVLFAYAILKHHLMNIKIIAAELFTIAIIFTLFINIFTAPTFNSRLLYIGILAAVSLFGYLLIKSVLREVRQREEIQRLAVSLGQANKRLVQLDKEKSEFLSIATHQLRTPMTVVKGYISMILEGAFGAFGDKAKEAMAKIYTSNERLIKLIDDLLNISRIERGKMDYDFQELALEKLVSDVVNELKPVAERKGLKINWQEPAGLPKVKFDEAKMRQVVLNLIDNAVKYTAQGEIDVKLEKINGQIRLTIKDTGTGLNKEKIPLLFKKYSRVETKGAYTKHIQGMGLGLYVAKRIIDDHKGKIWAESEGEGKGSAFFVELPESI